MKIAIVGATHYNWKEIQSHLPLISKSLDEARMNLNDPGAFCAVSNFEGNPIRTLQDIDPRALKHCSITCLIIFPHRTDVDNLIKYSGLHTTFTILPEEYLCIATGSVFDYFNFFLTLSRRGEDPSLINLRRILKYFIESLKPTNFSELFARYRIQQLADGTPLLKEK